MRVRSAIVRPWIKAGLSALLVESEQRAAELRGATGDSSAQRAEDALSPAPGGAAGKSVSARPGDFSRIKDGRSAGAARPAPREAVAPSSAPSAPPQANRPRRDAESAASNVRPGAGALERASTPGSSALLATPGALPVEAWPERWLVFKNRRPLPPHPLVLWTYAGLDEDLTGRPDDVRRKVIVRMLMELRHPGGTHVFWPCGLAGEPEAGAPLFWSGVKLLNPRVLLLFGSDARDALSMPKTLLPFCQERVFGRLVIQLPRPQSLAADEASFKQALAFLSRLLRFCGRPQA